MNCDACQRQLLILEDPDAPPAEVAAHLAECLVCRDWQRQLLQIEHNVRRLPVPASQPHAFLDNFLHPADTVPVAQGIVSPPQLVAPPPARATLPFSVPDRPAPRRWLTTVGGGLAAAAILIACGIFLGNFLSRALRPENNQANLPKPGPEKKAMAPLVAQLLESDLHLAEAVSPRQRVEHLAKIAQALESQTRTLIKSPAGREMEKLAQLYDKVVRKGVVERANDMKDLPREQRRQTLHTIADQLAQTSKEAEAQAQAAPEEAVRPLRLLAAAARYGDDQLRRLLGEDAE